MAAPANDNVANAEVFVGNSGSIVGTTVDSTIELGETWVDGSIIGSGTDQPETGTVWYFHVPTTSGRITFHMTAGALPYPPDTTELWSIRLAADVAAEPLAGTVLGSDLSFDVLIGQAFWLQIGTIEPKEFSFTWVTSPAHPLPRQSSKGRLGCGENTAYITWRCGSPRLCSIPSTDIEWDRRLDDISEALVTVKLSGNEDDTCCECLGDIEPWCHELHIVRDGEEVWLGPVTKVEYEYDTVTISAKDVVGWMTKRISEDPINFTNAGPSFVGPADLTNIGLRIIQEAFEDDDPCVLDYIQSTLTGRVQERFYEAFGDTTAEQLDQLAATGLNYTVAGRTIILGGEDLPLAPIATLTDDMILNGIKVTKDGLLQANRWYVHFEGDANVPAVSEVAPQCYGRLEAVRPADEGLQTLADAETTGDIYAAAAGTAPRIVEVSDGARLSPEAPWKINDMIPGARVDVALTRLCLDVTQSFRLANMKVTQSVEGEEVTVTLSNLNVVTGDAL